jgi:hypothetical protein
MTKNSIYNETGLIVKPSTNLDRELLKNFFDNSIFYAEYDSEWNCFMMPNSEDSIDALEMELTKLFNDMGISCRYEANIL